jgi:hypothetical protein
MRHISLIIAVLALAVAAPAIAGKGGNGNGNGNGGNGGGGGDSAARGSCTVSGDVLSASGLPVGVLLNLMASGAGGSWSQVLGYTDDGTWSMTVPATSGATYEFASRTWGPSGSPHYDVYASCSS